VKRYGALTPLDRIKLLIGYLMAQAVAWLYFDGKGTRFAIAVLTAAVLAVAVATRRRTAR
jgi:hypothetical protein